MPYNQAMFPELRFAIVEYDQEAVIYDRLSGDTHYLSTVAYVRLQGHSPADIASRLEIQLDYELLEQLGQIDEQFRAWGLCT